MADQSPSWKRPSDVMVMRKKRKPAANSARNTKESTRGNPGRKTTVAQLSRKRSNPFGCSPSKRRNSSKSGTGPLSEGNKPEVEAEGAEVEEEGAEEEKSDSLWNMLSETYTSPKQASEDTTRIENDKLKQQKQQNEEIQRRMVQKDTTITQPDKLAQIQNEQLPDDVITSRLPPLDWSLCTRMRFISTETFDWCSGLTSAEESVGLVGFTQGQKPLVTAHQKMSAAGKDGKYDVQKACMVWIHPNLPWCNLFPRMVADANTGKPYTLFTTEEVQKALLNDWTESLTSAYNLVRNGLCPYFYLCTHQFNVLWRSTNVGGIAQVHAFLSPTSRGLREAFTNEGIEFTMPLDKRKRKSADSAETTDNTKSTDDDNKSEGGAISKGLSRVSDTLDDDDEDEDLAQTDEGASSWLQSIGLNSNEYKSLNPDKVKLARDSSQAIDQRAESCILIQGPDTHALLNYLLNCRSCFATTGAQSGLPPTILAPVAFKGATLKHLKMKSQQIHRTQNEIEQCCGFEVSGPILPHTKLRLMRLFSNTHKQFTVSFSAHMPSAPFNAHNNSTNSMDKAVIADGSVTDEDQECVEESEQLKRSNQLGKKVIREAQYDNGMFSWVS